MNDFRCYIMIKEVQGIHENDNVHIASETNPVTTDEVNLRLTVLYDFGVRNGNHIPGTPCTCFHRGVKWCYKKMNEPITNNNGGSMRTIFGIVIIFLVTISAPSYGQTGQQYMGGSDTMMEGTQDGMPLYPPYQMFPGMGYGMGYGMVPGMISSGWGLGMWGPAMVPGDMGYGWAPAMMQRGRGYGWAPGPRRGRKGYGPSGPDSEELRKFFDETRELRKEMLLKRFEYREMMRNPDVKAADVEKILTEIHNLRMKIFRKRFKD
jgi:hypothetical protein